MFLKCWDVFEEEGRGTGLVEKRIFFLKNIWSWCGKGGGVPIHYALVGGGRGGVHPVCTCWEYYGLTGVKECWRKTLESDEQVQHYVASAALSSSGSRTMQQQTEGNHTLHDLWESTKKTLRIAAAIHPTHCSAVDTQVLGHWTT